MMSGILWIPDLQMCMLTFLIKAEIGEYNQVL